MLRTVNPGTQGYTVRPDGTWVHSSRKRNMTQENLYAYTETTLPEVGYVGYVSINRQEDATVTLTVRSPGAGSQATITLPEREVYALMAKLADHLYGVPGHVRPVRFHGVDPTGITRGAALPMLRDSWRFGFTEREDGLLTFGLHDDGPLVAFDAVDVSG